MAHDAGNEAGHRMAHTVAVNERFRQRMTSRLTALGYREATVCTKSPLRGHEFHFSVWDIAEPPSPAWRVEGPYMPAPAAMGHAERGLIASYLRVPLATATGARPAPCRRAQRCAVRTSAARLIC